MSEEKVNAWLNTLSSESSNDWSETLSEISQLSEKSLTTERRESFKKACELISKLILGDLFFSCYTF